jgi:hypothetical protein
MRSVFIAARTIAAAVVLGSALLACGGESTATPSASRTSDVDPEVQFAQCMRKNGYQMDDPVPGKPVQIRINPQTQAKFEAAQKACAAYAPKPPTSGPQASADYDRQLKLAQCLRKHGVDAPDPQPGKPFTFKQTQGNADTAAKALDTCQREIMGSGPGGANGPANGPANGGASGPANGPGGPNGPGGTDGPGLDAQ